MKKLILLIICLCAMTAALAQTQAGYVKTRGRMGGNGQVIPGSRLAGATIRIKGRNAVVSQASGAFSFPTPGNKYFVQGVMKQGYVLIDPESTIRQYDHSSVPLILVMETPERKTADKLENERKIRRTLQRQLQNREDEIEALKEENRITNAQYQEILRQLYDEQQSNERLISDMAERYSLIDFDQEDEFNLRISDCILNGRLTEADSLLRSKGDINARIDELNQHHEANVQTRSNLEKSEAMELKNRQDIAQDCYHFFEKFFMEHQNDSAARYIELRAGLDENNPQWQFDAGCFFQKRGQQQQADKYYQLALKAAREQAKADPQAFEPMLAHTLNNVALLRAEQGRSNQAADLFQEALDIYKRLTGDMPQVYDTYAASVQNNLALLYANSKDTFVESEQLFIQALDTYLKQAKENPRAFMPHAASVMNNLGLLYNENDYFQESEKRHTDALEIYRKLANTEPQAFQADVAATLNNLATLYHRNDVNGQECETMLGEAVQIYRQLAEEDMTFYGPKLAAALSNLAIQYRNHQRDAEGYRANEEELAIYETLAQTAPTTWLGRLAEKAYNLGITCYQAEEMELSSRFFQKALDAYRSMAKTEPGTYLPEVAKVLRNLATVKDMLQQGQQSEALYFEELAINQELAKANPAQYESEVARSYGNLSNHALLKGDFQQAVEYANKGLSHDSSKLFIQANLALAYLCQGDMTRAREIYQRYADVLKDTFLDDLHQFGTLGIIPPERQADAQAIIEYLSK